MAISIGDLSVIFLASNKLGQEENWQDLLAKCPNARRVEDGGINADSYAAAAVRATSAHFVTVEGDSVLDADFFAAEIDDGLLVQDCILIWPATNTVNNLCYEYGAIRCWPRPLALSRGGQAPAGPAPATVMMPTGYATHRINASPGLAFSHGFCEGVRLSTLAGRRLVRGHSARLPAEDYRRLLIWMSVGADAPHGPWAIYGARLGCKMASLGALDLAAVSAGGWLDAFWRSEVAPQFRGPGMICEKTSYSWDPAVLDDALGAVAAELRQRLDLPVAEETALDSVPPN